MLLGGTYEKSSSPARSPQDLTGARGKNKKAHPGASLGNGTGIWAVVGCFF